VLVTAEPVLAAGEFCEPERDVNPSLRPEQANRLGHRRLRK
jgi:hypothetical protein